MPVQLSTYQSNVLFGQNDVPTRIIIGFQPQSTFVGNFGHSAFRFKREFSKTDEVSNGTPQPVPFQSNVEPSIPCQEEPNLQLNRGQTFSSYIRGLFGVDDSSSIDIEQQIQHQPINQQSAPLETFTAGNGEFFIERCILTKDGKSLSSIMDEDASKDRHIQAYIQMAKVSGALDSNFSMGLSIDGNLFLRL